VEIRKLDAFCKVVELKSFTRAAEVMLLSQPTISEHIRSLEELFDQKLLDRLGREVAVTPAGSVLYGYARKILQTRSEAVQALTQYGGNLTGRIMIGCGTIPGTYILPQVIGTFRQQYPSIKTTLSISSSKVIAKNVLEGELEIGVVGAKWNNSGLSWREVFSDELILAVHPNHQWATRKDVSIKDVMQEPFILREQASGTRKVFAKILEDNKFKESNLQEVAEIGSTAAIKEAVKAGIGVSVLSRFGVRDDVACGRMAVVKIRGHTMYRPFYLIHRKNRVLSPVAEVFLEYLLGHEGSVQEALSQG